MYETIAATLITILVPMLINWIITRFSKEPVKLKKQRHDEMSSFLTLPIKSRNRLVVQDKFQYFFNYSYTFDEIIFALETNNPMGAFNAIKRYSSYIELDGEKLTFKKPYLTVDDRKNHYRKMNIVYWIGSLSAIFSIVRFELWLETYGTISIPYVFLFAVFMMLAAILSLNEANKPELAYSVISKIKNIKSE